MNIRQITFWEADSLLVDVSIQSELVETLAEVLAEVLVEDAVELSPMRRTTSGDKIGLAAL